jgi:murein DD-endopeptidase MepM/ murein hydrolase activator NlpD
MQMPEQILTEEELASPVSNSPVLTYETYRVKKGDMIGYIADKYDITQDTIISVNNIKQSRLIQVGQYLKIPSMPGILYTVKKDGETPQSIAKKYDINAEKCAFVNSLTPESSLIAGTSLFVPDAELDWATRQEINGDLFHKPLHARYWLSSPYGWRDSPFDAGKRTFHGGIDMAIGQGTPIYAALDGKVTATGFNSVYGNYVIITHHSGYKSLYGHMSRITCKKGNFVYTNTKIGEVGSTGMSTGPHLHFTVYKNGKTVNPLTLLN